MKQPSYSAGISIRRTLIAGTGKHKLWQKRENIGSFIKILTVDLLQLGLVLSITSD